MTFETQNRTSELANNVKNRLADTDLPLGKMAHDIGNKAGNSASRLAKQASEQFKSSKLYVQQHPEKGVLIAAGVGLAIGSMMTIAMRKRV